MFILFSFSNFALNLGNSCRNYGDHITNLEGEHVFCLHEPPSLTKIARKTEMTVMAGADVRHD